MGMLGEAPATCRKTAFLKLLSLARTKMPSQGCTMGLSCRRRHSPLSHCCCPGGQQLALTLLYSTSGTARRNQPLKTMHRTSQPGLTVHLQPHSPLCHPSHIGGPAGVKPHVSRLGRTQLEAFPPIPVGGLGAGDDRMLLLEPRDPGSRGTPSLALQFDGAIQQDHHICRFVGPQDDGRS